MLFYARSKITPINVFAPFSPSGTGAFGVVHRCREIKTGHVYAAKFIPISHAMEKALIRKEIDIMNHLHHYKLINLHDAYEDEDEMVLIFEL